MKITVKTRHSAEEDLPRWQQRHITRTFGKSDGAREQAATVVAKKASPRLALFARFQVIFSRFHF